MRCWAGGEDREAVLQVLARGQPLVVPPAASRKASGEEPFTHALLPPRSFACNLAPVKARIISKRRRCRDQNQHNQDNDAFHYHLPPFLDTIMAIKSYLSS